VVFQVAFSLVLLVGALLFSGSLRNLLAVDAGFRQNGLLIADVDFSRSKIPPARRMAFEQEMIERIRQLPGVASAAGSAILPLSGNGINNTVWKAVDPKQKMQTSFNWTSSGYLKTMGTPLLSGRDFGRS